MRLELLLASLAGLTTVSMTPTALAGDPPPVASYQTPSGVRVATFNASLNRSSAGELATELQTPGSAQPAAIAAIIQNARPDIVLINEFDYDAEGTAAAAFVANYLNVAQGTAVPIEYPYLYSAPSNTGVPSGFDLDNDGSIGGPNDAFGFGFFEGQFGMLVLSKYPIVTEDVRTFQNFLWKDMPGALLPIDPKTEEPWYTPEELEVVRLSSKSHWDIPIDVLGTTIHILASHPTPPVFDGPEDRNGRRNFDEIRFWADYINPDADDYIYDDDGTAGGLGAGARFVIVGDLNSDPFDGDSVAGAAQQLLDHPAVDASLTPASRGADEQATLQGGANDSHLGNAFFDTADFADSAPGNLRVDYALASATLQPLKTGVFWPRSDAPLFDLVGTFPFPSSDHRMVWIDLGVAGTTMPLGVSSGDVGSNDAVLWAHSGAPGEVVFEWSTSPDFSGAESATVTATDGLLPVKVEVTNLIPGTRYYHRATDSAGSTAEGSFTTPAEDGHSGVRFGVTGDWRGELAPYPAVRNIPDRSLDFLLCLGDTIYADVESQILPEIPQAMTLAEFRTKHFEPLAGRFGMNTWRAVRASTSLLAMIDDHEVTNDFAGGAHPSSDPRFAGQSGEYINETEFFANGLQSFVEFHPIRDEVYGDTGDPRTSGKRRLYRSRRWGHDAHIITLDARSFRDLELPPVQNPFDFDEINQFLVDAFDPTRTMLGDAQFNDVLNDLIQAQADGVTWKFVCVPEPVQNLGIAGASDRFEGYAAERTAMLDALEAAGVDNVVFVCADIHGTLINDIQYQLGPGLDQIDTGSFEVSTGSVAYAAPFGPTVVELALSIGLITQEEYDLYFSLPAQEQEPLLQTLINTQTLLLGYTTIGLEGAPIDASLTLGSWTATNTYGWTEFEVDASTQVLTVTTWGLDWYTPSFVLSDPSDVLGRMPIPMNRLVVQPVGFEPCVADINGDDVVNIDDLLALLAAWGSGDDSADIDGSGVVDTDDLLALLAGWGTC